MTNPIRIIVADDHPVVRDGLVAILGTQDDFEIVATADNGNDLIKKARLHQPNVILTDLEMPESDGIVAIQTLTREIPDTAFIVFTAFDTDERIVSAIRAGARGYLLKGAPRDDVFQAIRIVSAGGSLLEPSVASKLLRQLSTEKENDQNLIEPLTEREMEVLQHLSKGQTNKEIGADLFITERTVKFYVSAILGKLGASNRTEAVTLAVQRGIITLGE